MVIEQPNTHMSVNVNMIAILKFTSYGGGAGTDPRAGRVPQGDVLHEVDCVRRGDDKTQVRSRDSAGWEEKGTKENGKKLMKHGKKLDHGEARNDDGEVGVNRRWRTGGAMERTSRQRCGLGRRSWRNNVEVQLR